MSVCLKIKQKCLGVLSTMENESQTPSERKAEEPEWTEHGSYPPPIRKNRAHLNQFTCCKERESTITHTTGGAKEGQANIIMMMGMMVINNSILFYFHIYLFIYSCTCFDNTRTLCHVNFEIDII